MKFIKKKLRRWLLDDDIECEVIATVPSLVASRELSSNPIKFGLYKASGGIVVEVYNPRSRKDEPELHVIREEEDIGHRLSSILVLESLK